MRSPSAFYHRLVIFRLNSEERTGMVAYGTFFWRLYGFASEAAVRAHPEFLFISLEQFAVFHIGKKNFISSFMLLFNFADFGHEESNLRKALFFAVSANSGYIEVHSSFSPLAAIFKCSAVSFFRSPTSQNQIFA